MRTVPVFALLAALSIGIALPVSPVFAEDCDAMVDQIDQLLRTVTLSQEEKDQVMQLRDQGMDQNSRAGGDCTSALSQALDILKSK